MPNPILLDEKAVRQVLARAVELERQGGGALTETQVRDIARELSIPESAIEQALAEHRSSAAVQPPARRRWRPGLAVMVVCAIAVLALAFASVAVRVPAP
jgi:hypothetical protein